MGLGAELGLRQSVGPYGNPRFQPLPFRKEPSFGGARMAQLNMHNTLVNADAQGRPVAARPSPLGRGLHARYAAARFAR